MISDDTLRRVLPDAAVALLGDVIRWSLWTLVLVVWATFLPIYLHMIGFTLRDPSHSDFTIFYYTARMVRDGLPMYGVSPSRYGVTWVGDHLGNLNPPHFQLLALPLGYLSYAQALAVWVAVSLACLGGSLVLIARELRLPWSWRRFWLWGAFTLSSAAFTTVAVTCELTFFLMLPFTLAWRAWRAERWTAAGTWLGVCASVKLFVLLVVPWLIWRRQWRALGAFIASASLLSAVGIAAFGLDAYRQWTATLGRVGWWWLTMNASWQGFASRMCAGSATLTPAIHRPDLVTLIAVTGSCVFAATTIAVAARRRDHSRDRPILLLLLGAVLSSPLGWVYYLPLGYGPILGWMGAERHWEGLRKAGTPSVTLLLVGLSLLYVPQESTLFGQPSSVASLTIGSAYFWGLLSLWLAILTTRAT
ncbi:MAG: DUF2029 domain-containing protein [Chloroflexota bacterium]|nr:DUF2029 domain-containing protein [Chloroflexota bacterium]